MSLTNHPNHCSVEGCAEPLAKGRFCFEHWTAVYTGRLRKPRMKKRHNKKCAPQAWPGGGLSFLKSLLGTEQAECIPYPFGVTGRGSVVLYGRRTDAHRAMCRLAHGLPPDDKPYALHSCGNGHERCVNPSHLYWGDWSDNMKDAHRHKAEREEQGEDGRDREVWSTA